MNQKRTADDVDQRFELDAIEPASHPDGVHARLVMVTGTGKRIAFDLPLDRMQEIAANLTRFSADYLKKGSH